MLTLERIPDHASSPPLFAVDKALLPASLRIKARTTPFAAQGESRTVTDQNAGTTGATNGATGASAAVAYSAQTTWMLAVRNARDKAAFAALFDHFAPRLKGFVMRSGASSGQAEEIVQEVMLTVWRKAEQFDPARAQVSSWIYQIARNRQIDVFRAERTPLPEDLAPEAEDFEPDASQILGLEQEAERLKSALAQLAPEQRVMIEKAYLGELTHQEISAQTGLPLGTIKSRIRLGMERLRHTLKDMR